MQISRRLLMGFTGVTLAAAVAIPVFAATSTSTTTTQNPRQALIQALVQRFSLNQSDVQQFFQDQQNQHFTDMLTRLGTRLGTDVTKGTITEAQKNAILDKAKEAKAKFDSLSALSPTDRQTQLKQYRTDLETWATQQSLGKQYLRDILMGLGGPGGPGGFRGGHHGFGGRGGGMGMHRGAPPQGRTSSTPTQN